VAHPYTPYSRDFAYVGRYSYLLTCVTFARSTIFTSDATVDLVWSHIVRAARERQFEVIAYCFMPDHAHLIAEGCTAESNLKAFASAAKQYSGYYYKQSHPPQTLWQHGSNDHIIRDEVELLDKIRYVVNNPVAAGLVSRPEDYPYLGSQRWSRDELIRRARIDGKLKDARV
jgi:putative transposase